MRLVGFADFKIELDTFSGNNLNNWKRSVEQFSEEEGHNIVKNFVFGFDEQINSNDFEKGDFSELIGYFKTPENNPALIVIPDSRYLASNLIELVSKVIKINSLKCKIECIKSPWNDPINDSLNRLSLTGVLKQSDIRKRESILFKVNRGEVVTKSPIGYKIGSEGNLIIDRDNDHIVKKIFSLYTGVSIDQFNQLKSKLGLRKIATYLNNNSLKTKSGNWWSPSSIDVVLKNRTYTGIYQRSGVIITQNHPNIINEKLFDKAKEIRRSRKIHRRPKQNKWLFNKGLVRCGICSRNMNFKNILRTWKSVTGDIRSKNYRYYYCFSISCSGKNLNNINFEYLFEEIVKQMLKTTEKYKEKSNSRLVHWRISGSEKISETRNFFEQKFLTTLRDVSRGKKSINQLTTYLNSLKKMDEEYKSSEDEVINVENIMNDLSKYHLDNSERIFYLINNLINFISIKNNSVKIIIKAPLVFDT
jgi:hypothetical protein